MLPLTTSPAVPQVGIWGPASRGATARRTGKRARASSKRAWSVVPWRALAVIAAAPLVLVTHLVLAASSPGGSFAGTVANAERLQNRAVLYSLTHQEPVSAFVPRSFPMRVSTEGLECGAPRIGC